MDHTHAVYLAGSKDKDWDGVNQWAWVSKVVSVSRYTVTGC